MGAPIQGTGEFADQPTIPFFQSRLGQQVVTGNFEQMAVISPKVIEQNEEIIRLLKTINFHMEMITGQEGAQIG